MSRFRSFRPRGFLALLIVVLGTAVLASAGFTRGSSQDDPPRFRVEIADGVSPVRNAPVTIEVTRLDETGAPDETFDWRSAGVRISGVEDLTGKAVDPGALLPASGEAVIRGTPATAARIEDGRLVLSSVVITGTVEILYGDVRHPAIPRTIFGFMAILAPLVAVFLAIATRQVIFALFVAVWVGGWGITGGPWDGFDLLASELFPGVLNRDRVSIVIFSCLLGSVVALVARMGGTKGLVDVMSRFGRNRRGAQITTWLTGVVIFFDDYANALLVGNTMRPISDRFRVSREKLSYLVDSTSAPVACIAVISTWIATEIGYIEGKLSLESVQAATGLSPGQGYQAFVDTVPYGFYPILALVFGLAVCVMQRDFGPMLRAERRAEREGKVLADDAVPLSSREMDDLVPVDPSRLRWYNAAIPIGVVIASVIGVLFASGHAALEASGVTDPALRDVFGSADSYKALLIAAFLGVITAAALSLGQRLMSLRETVEVMTAGIKAMIPAMLVLVLAWVLQTVCERLNTSQWLIHQVTFTLSLLPAVVFLLAAAVGFSTGTSWGTMGILIPLTIDYVVGLASADGLGQPETYQALVASTGAVLAGAVFGDHCSPISDTTIMSSMACGADHIDHVRTQMPYALTVALIALVCGYLPAGYGVSPWVCLPAGAAACVLVVRFVGRKVD